MGDAPAVYVIAEAGVNHDGDVATAHELVDLAAASGADAVKFQTFDPDLLVAASAGTTRYQRESGAGGSQATMLRGLVLPRPAWTELRDHSAAVGIDFLSTPFDHASAEFLRDLGVTAVKIGSGDLTNSPLLRLVAGFGVPLLLSTGMAVPAEITTALAAVGEVDVTLLHCVSAYPAPAGEANLTVLPRLREQFGVPVGWSDHTLEPVTAVMAVALGATVLEKHITLDTRRPGPDHAASADPVRFREYVLAVRTASAARGDGVKRRMPSETENAPLVRRSWHTTTDLPAGHVLIDADLVALRPETGVVPSVDLRGRRTTRALAAGVPVTPEVLAP